MTPCNSVSSINAMATTSILYAEREEWSDVQRVPLDEGPKPFAPILYSNEYKDAMEHFLGIQQTNEYSQRALDLTTHLIHLSPALYPVWHYRQQILTAINADFSKERDFLSEMIFESPKNYQVWHHRKFVIDNLGDPSNEKIFLNTVLSDDAKNYHTWIYRQWLITKYELWSNEYEIIDELIDVDVRNNSAWTYRHFLDMKHPSPQSLEEIVTFTLKQIKRAPSNESPWNYLQAHLTRSKDETQLQRCTNFAQSLIEGQSQSPHVYSFMFRYYLHTDDRENALSTCVLLEEQMDKPRKLYWANQRIALNKKHAV